MDKGIIPIEYKSKFPMMEWLHATRHYRKAKDGKHIPEEDRIYVDAKFDDFVRIVPLSFQLYKDRDEFGEMYFFNRKELENWDEWRGEIKEVLEKHSFDIMELRLVNKLEMRIKMLDNENPTLLDLLKMYLLLLKIEMKYMSLEKILISSFREEKQSENYGHYKKKGDDIRKIRLELAKQIKEKYGIDVLSMKEHEIRKLIENSKVI